ncbi:N-acetylmuramoyl-L-alanine amidase [Loigolactobacillus rennini]|uniref:N-acetylmuramidase n=1 Tax=Loigolactobacillus rennini DSM 20253 TaxID=1423796 RepID=A0A0R2D4E1_9LACO|nr:N-acetylmuramoyl-L-alanine amidase [Loigolactobacillus rennini]KRM98753.1 N-acetylmuramidase [Loigolactobacillus rennini DSM 20253]
MKKSNKLKVILGATAFAAALLFGATNTANAYNVDKSFALGASEGSSQVANNKYVVLHDVGTESGARDNASYFKNNWNSSYTYTQYVVGDGGQVYQVGQPGYVAWGAGTYANANSPVQIELGHANTYAQFKQDYAAYVKLAHDSARQFGIPLQFNNINGGIITHNFVSQNMWGNHSDPVGYLNKWGVSQETLGKDVVTGVSSLGTADQPVADKPASNQNPGTTNSNLQRHLAAGFKAENGTFVNGDTPIQVRHLAGTGALRAGMLPAYASIKYDSWINYDGYTWVHYVGYNGRDLYLPVHPTGTTNNLWGQFK